ncbi:MAG: hypothetical protein FJY95_00515 [Candidatus Handelsmanbacteria bacterium]|nr:hypothetical protein [Candidatus Handelsmanbacteria bacterium]
MIWAIISMLCVLGTKVVTAMRLKGMKRRHEDMKPLILELRAKVEAADTSYETIKSKEQALEVLNNHLRDAMRQLEGLVKEPANSRDDITKERVQVMQSEEGKA